MSKLTRHPIKRRRTNALRVLVSCLIMTMIGGWYVSSTRLRVVEALSVTTLGLAILQSFDTLPSSGSATFTNDSTLPGWYHARTGTGTTIVANDGGSNAGNLYSYGTGTATDRALGSLGSGNAAIGNFFWGIRLTNNTGSTITSLDVSYVGEQWRNSAAAAQTISFSYLVGSPTVTGSLAEFQSAGVAVAALDFTSPITGGTAIALNGNLAANRVARSATISGLNIPNGTEIMLRWSDPDHTGADHGLSIDEFSVTPQGGAPVDNPPIVSTTVPADNATNIAVNSNISVTFSEAVTATASSFTISCTTSGAHAFGLSGGPSTYTLDPTIDFTQGEVCTVTVVAAQVTDQDAPLDQMAADYVFDFTIINTAPVPIHTIQGSGTSSPLAGLTVTTSGIVTLLRTGSNAGAGAASGFFMQEPDASADADPNTSEGIFVFTSSVPTVAVGDAVTVTGTAVEFNGLTEISPVTNVTVNSTGNALPTPVTLTTTILDPAALYTQPQLEKYESMRMSAASLTVTAPNDNFYDVATVLPSVPRQQVFREPGIPASDPVPPDPTSGLVDCCIPIWDENPERLMIDTNGRAGSPLVAYTSNVVFTNVAGPLDFAFGQYRLIPDAALTATANMTAVPVPAPLANEFTVAGYNLINFDNNAVQREKASLAIRTILRYPDILGMVEIFDLADLQALRDEINNDAVAAGDPNPLYEAYLIEQDGTSGDGDQDVGFLVKTSRVSVNSVTQEGETETFVEPGGGTAILHDRPPLVLDAQVDPTGVNTRVLVVVNHLRSFIDVELVAGDGPRVREKRKQQAESLGMILQTLQTNNPATSVISVGDYNAFQFSSGYDDSLSVLKGSPTADDQIVVDQSPDVVNPNFINLIESIPADQRYSFVFENTAQVLDHVLVNTVAQSLNTRITFAHVNADFPADPTGLYETNVAVAERNSDHDPAVAYFLLLSPTAADGTVSGTITDNQGQPIAGTVVNLSGTQNRKTITDAAGNYRFDNVETSGFYTVTPSRVNYTFGPTNRTFTQLGNQTEAAFTGSAGTSNADPMNTPEYFVRQQYLDFLGREPDEAGFNFWSDQILECGVDASCAEVKRINISAAYFLSIEFQRTGGLVDGLYRASFGRAPKYAEFMPDTVVMAQNVVVGRGDWEGQLRTNQQAFVQSFVNRSAFQAAYDGLNNAGYVDALITNTGVSFGASEREGLVSMLNRGASRGEVLLQIAENEQFVNSKRNAAFVMMEYFGYLRRDPDASGYQFWLNKLNQFNGNFVQAEMVKAFINSDEYRARFGR